MLDQAKILLGANILAYFAIASLEMKKASIF
jgi:hypothetical protein